MAVRLGSAYGLVEIGTGRSLANLNLLSNNLGFLGIRMSGAAAGAIALGAAFVGVGVAAVTMGKAISDSVKEAADLEKLAVDIDAIQLASADAVVSLDDIKEAILALATDPTIKVGFEDAADAIKLLVKNGLDLQTILRDLDDDGTNVVKAVIAMSNALGEENFALAADVATDAMLLFNKEAEEMPAIVDQITGAVLNSKFELQDFQYALSNAGGVANLVGVEFEELVQAIAFLAPSFRSGRDAGTSLKTFLQRLVPQSDKAKEAFEKLNLEFFTMEGQLKSLPEIIQELKDGFAGLSEQQINELLKQAFGAEGARAAARFISGPMSDYYEISERIGRTNALEIAAEKMKTFHAQVDIMKDAIQGWAAQAGEPFLALLTQILLKINEQDGIVDVWGRRWVSTMAAISAAFEKIVPYILQFIDLLSGAATIVLPDFNIEAGASFTDFINMLAEWIPQVSGYFRELKGQILEQLAELGPAMVMKAHEWSMQLLEWVSTDGGQAFMNLGMGLSQAIIDGMMGDIENADNWVKIGAAIILAVSMVVAAISVSILAAGGQIVAGLFAGMWNAITGGEYTPYTVQQLANLIRDIALAVKEHGVIVFWELAKELLLAMGRGIEEAAVALMEPWVLAFAHLFQGVFDWATAEMQRLIFEWGHQVRQWFIDAWNNLVNEAQSMGRNLTDSLARGIWDAMPSLQRAIDRLADLARRAMQYKFQIWSPSRVFRDFGRDLTRGFALGIGDLSHLVAPMIERNLINPAIASMTPNMAALAPAAMAARNYEMNIAELSINGARDPVMTGRAVRGELTRLFEEANFAGSYRYG